MVPDRDVTLKRNAHDEIPCVNITSMIRSRAILVPGSLNSKISYFWSMEYENTITDVEGGIFSYPHRLHYTRVALVISWPPSCFHPSLYALSILGTLAKVFWNTRLAYLCWQRVTGLSFISTAMSFYISAQVTERKSLCPSFILHAPRNTRILWYISANEKQFLHFTVSPEETNLRCDMLRRFSL